MKNGIRLAVAVTLGISSFSAAAATFDCAALGLSGETVPAGYSGECAGAFAPALGGDFRFPADIGYTIDILGNANRPPDRLYTFTINNFAGQVLRNAVTPLIFGIDFSPNGNDLYAVTSAGSATFPLWLGTLPAPNGDFAPIQPLSGVTVGDQINGFAIDPRSGVAYLSTSGGNPVLARLFTVNLETAAATFIGTMFAPTDAIGTIMVSLAINCDGALYAHNISDDALYQVNPVTAATTLIGSHGLAANFAQGMDFDNSDGQLYAFMMLFSGENRFGRLDTNTGAFTTLSNNDPTGEFEGAFPGVCAAESLIFANGFEN